ncbi:hypothetical protein ACH42_06310 [Endozoicomonas sp. (ex Bugula neritina AB1)]|nr:hypothetical protein ACH42_06310 [Endozoicomonas sp. (ex Bugula neritina AB1)]
MESSVKCLLIQQQAEIDFIKTCILEIKEAVGDQATLQELCDKVEVLEEKLCGPCSETVAGEMTANQVVVEGETDAAPGDTINLFNETGENVGTAEVTAVAYNAETNQSTLTLQNTQATAELSTVKTVKKQFVAATKIERSKEAVKQEQTKEAATRTGV